MITLEALNRQSPENFVTQLSGIFEHSPWVPRRALTGAPFDSRLSLLQAMRSVVREASGEEQLALINAHPKLGARGRTRERLTAASSNEQKRAGLDACSDEEYAHLQRVNAAYLEKFGFPFILAVRGHDPPAIIAHLERRYHHDRAQELRSALHEIGLIAAYRLAEVVSSGAAVEIAAMLTRLQLGSDVALIIEWMRAANLTVWSDGEHRLIGIARTPAPDARTLLVGLHYDAITGSLKYDGALGWITGVAIAQRLREQGVALPYHLAVFALAVFADAAPCADGCLPQGRVALSSIDQTAPDQRELMTALRSAGLTAGDFVIESARSLEAMDGVERSSGVWREFLLQTFSAA